MVEFKSKGTYCNKKGDTIFAVLNNKDRKRVGKIKDDFSDLFPKVKIDGRIYRTVDIESFNISHVSKGNPIGIVIK